MILADDMGFSDARCYGGDVDTPNLDRLAAGGVRFTQAYSTARCGPSRSCLLTGYYAQQTASDVMTPGNVPSYTRFIPDYLKPLGYRTYHSGKWHMRFATGAGGVGFDHSYTMLDEFRFFTQNRHELDGQPLPKPGEGYYSTTAISDYAVRFLQGARAGARAGSLLPVSGAACAAFPVAGAGGRYRAVQGPVRRRVGRGERTQARAHAPHGSGELRAGAARTRRCGRDGIRRMRNSSPRSVRAKWRARSRGATLTAEQKAFQRTKMAIHAAMITRMDLEIGKVLRQLEAMGAERDTVILFLSDNGASSEQLIRGDGHDRTAPPGSAQTHLGLGPGWASCSNAPFRLHKSWVNEGGIASPMIVHWPNGIKDAGKLRHDPCHFVDVLPTLVDLAGGSAVPEGGPPLAGRSFAPALRKDGAVPREFLYFNHNDNRAIRVGDWKLIATGKDGPWELYDLSKDRCEQHDLAGGATGPGAKAGGDVDRARRGVRAGERERTADHEGADEHTEWRIAPWSAPRGLRAPPRRPARTLVRRTPFPRTFA